MHTSPFSELTAFPCQHDQPVGVCYWRSRLPPDPLGDGSGTVDLVCTDLLLLRLAKVRVYPVPDSLHVILIVRNNLCQNHMAGCVSRCTCSSSESQEYYVLLKIMNTVATRIQIDG